jgi:hypothetical protein
VTLFNAAKIMGDSKEHIAPINSAEEHAQRINQQERGLL